MIKSFSSDKDTIQEFISKVTSMLSSRELGKIVSISAKDENDVVVTFSKLGKSEVIFSLKSKNSGFECVHKSEKIAITHKVLRSDIENKFAKVLESNGAAIVQG